MAFTVYALMFKEALMNLSSEEDSAEGANSNYHIGRMLRCSGGKWRECNQQKKQG